MNKTFNARLRRTEYEIYSGEYFVTGKKDIVMTTLLGSCIAVCMRDFHSPITGINHFLLPDFSHRRDKPGKRDTRYGIYAMEVLLEDMILAGANRKSLQAKFFGGGQAGEDFNNVSQANINFAFRYLKKANIPVLNSDVGGRIGRKIFFFPDTFTVLMKRIPFEVGLNQKKLLTGFRQPRIY